MIQKHNNRHPLPAATLLISKCITACQTTSEVGTKNITQIGNKAVSVRYRVSDDMGDEVIQRIGSLDGVAEHLGDEDLQEIVDQ